MNQSAPMAQLCEIIDFEYVTGIDTNINAFTIDNLNLKLNIPSKIGCFGVMLIKEGSIDINLDSQDLMLQPCSILQILPGSIINFKKISDNIQIECILFSNEFFSDLNLEWGSNAALDVLSNKFSKLILLNDDGVTSISTNMERIKTINSKNNTRTNFVSQMLKSYFSLIVYEITYYRQMHLESEYDSLTFRKEDIAVQFVNLVGEHFQSHKDVQFYADLMLITRIHLTRTIKDVLMKTPKKIIEDKIISEAKILLFGNETINHVMSTLNFEDQGAFTKFFKKYTGQTPGLYRKSLVATV